MISQDEVELLKLKESRYDFVEDEGSDNEPPIRKKLGRISETMQTFTYYDLHKASAELTVSIDKANIELSPAIFKNKVANLKSAMKDQIKTMKDQKKLIDDEIVLINEQLDMDNVEREFQLAIHEKLKAEELKETK